MPLPAPTYSMILQPLSQLSPPPTLLSLSLSSLSPRDPIFSDDRHRGRRKRRRTSSTLREMYTAQGREAWRQGKEGRVKGKGRAGHVRSASKNEPPAGRPDLLLEELK